ncbi:MAG: HAD-IA family hydrolase [Pseudomonadota bacterium]
MQLRAVIFDVDGTLVDSQGDIIASMAAAFARAGRQMPERQVILSMVGLSLDVIFPRLVPDADAALSADMVRWYKESYAKARLAKGSELSSPLYPGARDCLNALQAQDSTLLGVATGKSRRGLNGLISAHGLQGMFLSQHCADDHPSKPHPSMLMAAMDDLAVAPDRAVMIGDTSYDLDMARAAGCWFIGVSWGYHDTARLDGADAIVSDFAMLPAAIDRVLETAHV